MVPQEGIEPPTHALRRPVPAFRPAKNNKDVGSKVDSMTTHLGMAVLFKKRLDVAFSALGGGLLHHLTE